MSAAMVTGLASGRLTPEALPALAQRLSKRTLGNLVIVLRQQVELGPDSEAALRTAVTARNQLAHYFFRDNLARMRTVVGCEHLVSELREHTVTFIATGRAVDTENRRFLAHLGTTPVPEHLQRVIEREEADPDFARALESIHLGPAILRDLLQQIRGATNA